MTGDERTQPVENADPFSAIADAMDGDGGDAEETLLPGEAEEDGEVVEEESEEDESSEEDEDESDDETDTITHDGKPVTLKKSEIRELAQKGFDYTQKTMQVAEERKAIQAEHGKVKEIVTQHDQALQETHQRLQGFVNYLQSQVGDPPPISLAHENASQYLALKEAHEAQKGQLQQALANAQAVEDERARIRQASQAFRAEQTWNELRDTLPGWKEDADAAFADLDKYVKALGLDGETALEARLSKGFWELAHKAKQFDALQVEKSKLKPKEQLRKVEAPKATRQSSRSEIRQADRQKAYAKNPSLSTLADLIG